MRNSACIFNDSIDSVGDRFCWWLNSTRWEKLKFKQISFWSWKCRINAMSLINKSYKIFWFRITINLVGLFIDIYLLVVFIKHYFRFTMQIRKFIGIFENRKVELYWKKFNLLLMATFAQKGLKPFPNSLNLETDQ